MMFGIGTGGFHCQRPPSTLVGRVPFTFRRKRSGRVGMIVSAEHLDGVPPAVLIEDEARRQLVATEQTGKPIEALLARCRRHVVVEQQELPVAAGFAVEERLPQVALDPRTDHAKQQGVFDESLEIRPGALQGVEHLPGDVVDRLDIHIGKGDVDELDRRQLLLQDHVVDALPEH